MSFCNQCGSEQDESNAWCTNCGEANASLNLPMPEPSAIPSGAIVKPYQLEHFKLALSEHFKKPYFREAVGVILVSVIAFISLTVIGDGRTNSGYLFFGWLGFFLLLCPLSFGALVILFAREVSPKWLVSFESWLDHRCAKSAESSGRLNDYVIYPSLWAYEKLNTTTDQIGDDTLRNGAKAATYVFTVCLFLFLLYVAIGIVLFIIGIAIAIAIINAWEGSNGSGQRSASTTYSPRSHGESREREGVFGNYTEHRDETGKVVGESREREGVFGNYTEHRDETGKKAGESREREGVFGNYTEHRDETGKKAGESREREGVFGNYTEHRDETGKVVSESRERDGFFGKHTETKKRDS